MRRIKIKSSDQGLIRNFLGRGYALLNGVWQRKVYDLGMTSPRPKVWVSLAFASCLCSSVFAVDLQPRCAATAQPSLGDTLSIQSKAMQVVTDVGVMGRDPHRRSEEPNRTLS